MKEIVKPDRFVLKLLSNRQTNGTERRLTRHCVTAECPEGVLFYHTLTGELVLAEKDEISSPELRSQLAGKLFFLRDGEDENRMADSVRRMISVLKPAKKSVTGFTVLTTTDCNARCFYCYEKGARRLSMTEETAEKVADHIAEVSRGDRVKIAWFGGEPLFNRSALTVITRRLSEKGLPFSSSMTSNGYLFDEDTVKEASELWNLKSVQITVDGTEAVYNRTKAYISSEDNPFARVMRNIGLLADRGITVFLRLNMNRSNYPDLMKLAGELGRRFGGREEIKAYPVMLRSFAGEVGEFADCKDEVRAYFYLKNELKANRIGRRETIVLEGFPTGRCMADNDGCEVIHPDGSLAKCEHFDETEVFGDVFSDIRKEGVTDSWKERVVFDECRVCAMYPRCINLKKCAWAAFGCSEALREIRIRQTRDRMLETFYNSSENTGGNNGERS